MPDVSVSCKKYLHASIGALVSNENSRLKTEHHFRVKTKMIAYKPFYHTLAR